jgi:hypothetical protein
VIRQVEQYHGAALARLIRWDGSPTVSLHLHEEYRSAYVLDECVAVYVKYSTNRLSPWTFSFKPEHRGEISSLQDDFEELCITLVCGTDGIACLSSVEYDLLLNGGMSVSERVRVARAPRQKYVVSVADQKRSVRIGNNEFPAKVYSAIRMASQ